MSIFIIVRICYDISLSHTHAEFYDKGNFELFIKTRAEIGLFLCVEKIKIVLSPCINTLMNEAKKNHLET